MYTELDAIKRLTIRRDCFWRQNTFATNGKYAYRHVKSALQDFIIEDSIKNKRYTIGTATTQNGTNLCVAPIIDIDAHNEEDILDPITTIYAESIKQGYHPILESSGGDDILGGCHIIFPCKPTQSAYARKALQKILITCGYKLTDHEVFPKQDTVAQDSYGNVVKTIFQYHNKTGNRGTIINPETMKPFERQDAINFVMECPDNVFPEIPTTNTTTEEEIVPPTQSSESDKQEVPPKNDIPPKSTPLPHGTFMQDFGEYCNNSGVYECVKCVYSKDIALHGKGEAGHKFRLAAASNLLDNGMDKEIVQMYFENQKDYSESITRKQIKDTVAYLGAGKLGMGCAKLKEVCKVIVDECNVCEICFKNKKKTKKETPTDSNTIKSDSFDNSDEHFYTDMKNSARLAEKIKGKIRWNSRLKCWMIYNGKQWIVDSESNGTMMRFARQVANDLAIDALTIEDLDKKRDAMGHALECQSMPRLRAMVTLCQSELGVFIDADEFDKDIMLFNVQNGTIDLRTGKLLPHNPLDYISKISPITYNPNATCPRFMDFLDEALLWVNNGSDLSDEAKFERAKKTDNVIEYLHRYGGYCLTGAVNEEQLTILYGDGGNGKSKFTFVIEYIMGDYAGKIDMATIKEASRARDGSAASANVVKLKGLRFITSSEPEKGLKLNESRIKDWTGRDKITARALYQEEITFQPMFKLCIYTNYLLIIRGQDKSMWRRLQQVGFNNPPAIVDKDLDKKLMEEGSGILNWLIAGCLDWQKQGLNVPTEIVDSVNEYKKEMDVLSGFFETCCIRYTKDSISLNDTELFTNDKNINELGNDLFHAYQAWWMIDNHSDAPYFNKQFFSALHERGYKKEEKYSKKGLMIRGIKLNTKTKDALAQVLKENTNYNITAMIQMKGLLA